MESKATKVWMQPGKQPRTWRVYQTGQDGETVAEFICNDRAAAKAKWLALDREMLMAKYGGKLPSHTPGPWYVRGAVGYAGYGVNDNADVSVAAFPSTMKRDPGELTANALLIAAAPELLAALERAAEFLNRNYTRDDMADILVPVNAALARARGQA